ncbi:hypothetical protein, partial [Polaromonas sp.]|uniref:hypothetical protein n=1 Tax=Polaromonas sp. TaxID=1869339 RepID=UPI003525BFF5
MHQFLHRTDLVAERQAGRTAEEKSFARITLKCMAELLVDAELAHAGHAVAQTTVGEAVKRHITFGLDMSARLEPGFEAKVLVQPGRAHRTRRQS